MILLLCYPHAHEEFGQIQCGQRISMDNSTISLVTNSSDFFYDAILYQFFLSSVNVSDITVIGTFGVLINLLIVLSLLLTSSLRSDPFYWKLCSFFIWNILVLLESIAQYSVHSQSVLQSRTLSPMSAQSYPSCRVWVVIDNVRVPVTYFAILTMLLDRYIEIIFVKQTITSQLRRLKDLGLLPLPWFIMLVAMIPLSVQAQKDGLDFIDIFCMTSQGSWLHSYIIIFEFVPLVILVLLMEGSMIFFALKINSFPPEVSQTAETTGNNIRDTLKSILAMLFVCVSFFLYHECIMLKLSKCNLLCCNNLFEQKHAAYLVSILGNVFSPLAILLINDVRAAMMYNFRFLLFKCKILKPRNEVMSLSPPILH